jgi:hypothetical protein
MRRSPNLPLSVGADARTICQQAIQNRTSIDLLRQTERLMAADNPALQGTILELWKSRLFRYQVNDFSATPEKPVTPQGAFLVGVYTTYMAFSCDPFTGPLPTIPAEFIRESLEASPPVYNGKDWHFAVNYDEQLPPILQDIEGSPAISVPAHNALYSGAGLVSLVVRDLALTNN